MAYVVGIRELKCHQSLARDALSRLEKHWQFMLENRKNAVCLALLHVVGLFQAHNFGGPQNTSVRQVEWGLLFLYINVPPRLLGVRGLACHSHSSCTASQRPRQSLEKSFYFKSRS